MDKRLLYVGGSHADIPIIKAAKKLGFFVITTGNKPSDLGHAYGDRYINADFSDCEAIYTLAKEQKVTAICASCNDFAALSASYAANKLGLLGHDNYEICKRIHHKDLFRAYLMRQHIRCPYGKGYDSKEKVMEESDSWNWPVIVKPIDLTGGKGIKVAYTKEELENVAEGAFKISRAKRIVVEEFIQGTRHGFTSIISNQKVKFYFCDNEHYYKNPYMVSGASCPSSVGKEVQEELCHTIEDIAKDLKLVDGIVHVQFILKDEKPYIIEVCRRAPGDLYIELVKYATGIDYAMWILKASIGEECSQLAQSEISGYFTRHCIMAEKEGVIKNIVISDEIKDNIFHKMIWAKPGDRIDNALVYKAGIVFVTYSSQEEMNQKVNNLETLIRIQIED